MDNGGKLVLTLLVVTVFSSGCINGGHAEGPESIEVQELTVNPSTVYEDSNLDAVLEVSNIGTLSGNISIEEDGDNIMADQCQDFFDLEDFNYNAPPTAEIGENQYRLEQGDSLRFTWGLRQSGNVPLYDVSCDLRFEVPFNYSVQAFNQIEVRENLDVEGAEQLDSRSSSGPMTVLIDTIPGMAGQRGVYSLEDDEEITTYMRLQNQVTEDGYGTGIIGIEDDSLEIDIPEELYTEEAEDRLREEEIDTASEEMCDLPEQGLTMHEGSSEDIRCDLDMPDELEGPAQIFEITASAEYEYLRDAGSRNVEVARRG